MEPLFFHHLVFEIFALGPWTLQPLDLGALYLEALGLGALHLAALGPAALYLEALDLAALELVVVELLALDLVSLDSGAIVWCMPWIIAFPAIWKSFLGSCLCCVACGFCCCVKSHSDHCGFGDTGVTTLCFRYLYCSCKSRGVRRRNGPHIFCIFQFLVSPVFTFSIFSQPMCMSIGIGIGHWQGHGHWLGHGVGPWGSTPF